MGSKQNNYGFMGKCLDGLAEQTIGGTADFDYSISKDKLIIDCYKNGKIFQLKITPISEALKHLGDYRVDVVLKVAGLTKVIIAEAYGQNLTVGTTLHIAKKEFAAFLEHCANDPADISGYANLEEYLRRPETIEKTNAKMFKQFGYASVLDFIQTGNGLLRNKKIRRFNFLTGVRPGEIEFMLPSEGPVFGYKSHTQFFDTWKALKLENVKFFIATHTHDLSDTWVPFCDAHKGTRRIA